MQTSKSDWTTLKRLWAQSELTNEQMIGQLLLWCEEAHTLALTNRQEHRQFVRKVQKLLTQIVERLTAVEGKGRS